MLNKEQLKCEIRIQYNAMKKARSARDTACAIRDRAMCDAFRSDESYNIARSKREALMAELLERHG